MRIKPQIITALSILLTLSLALTLNAQSAQAANPKAAKAKTRIHKITDKVIDLRDGECFVDEAYTTDDLLQELRQAFPRTTFKTNSQPMVDATPKKGSLKRGVVYLGTFPGRGRSDASTTCRNVTMMLRFDADHSVMNFIVKSISLDRIILNVTPIIDYKVVAYNEMGSRLDIAYKNLNAVFAGKDECSFTDKNISNIVRRANRRLYPGEGPGRIYLADSIDQVIKRGKIGRRIALIQKDAVNCRDFTLLARSSEGEYYKYVIKWNGYPGYPQIYHVKG